MNGKDSLTRKFVGCKEITCNSLHAREITEIHRE
jgi:hypothetical protein